MKRYNSYQFQSTQPLPRSSLSSAPLTCFPSCGNRFDVSRPACVSDGTPKLVPLTRFVIWFTLIIVACKSITVLFLFPIKQATLLPYVERTVLPAVWKEQTIFRFHLLPSQTGIVSCPFLLLLVILHVAQAGPDKRKVYKSITKVFLLLPIMGWIWKPNFVSAAGVWLSPDGLVIILIQEVVVWTVDCSDCLVTWLVWVVLQATKTARCCGWPDWSKQPRAVIVPQKNVPLLIQTLSPAPIPSC